MTAMLPASDRSTIADLQRRLAQVERRAERERAARLEAEAIAEQGLRELFESQKQLLLVQRITIGANQNRGTLPALRLAVSEICQYMGWSFGNAYLTMPDGGMMACDTWYAAELEPLFEFIEISRNVRFPKGYSLPGRVARDPRPHWIEDVTTQSAFERLQVATRCGLRAACAFPIMIGDEVAGVLEFFSRDRLVENDDFMSVVGQLGTQLGRVIERERAQQALLHDALHDALTGLPNRTLLSDRLKQAFDRARPDRRGELAVMVIDLDGFKSVNDTLGHATGDAVLRDIARRLTECMTRQQAADGQADLAWFYTLARIGGDEFTAVIEAPADSGIAERVAERIHAALAERDEGERDLGVTASIGIAYDAPHYAEVDHLHRDADLAMYQAKAQGRHRTVVLSESLGDQIRDRLVLEQELREALKRHEFVLFFQPIVDMDDADRVTGFEALVRWNHPTRGLLLPKDFIDLAEETGLILFLGDWVLQNACRIMADWHRRFGGSPLPTVSINVSPRQFVQPDFARRVDKALISSAIDPTTVRLELTEATAIRDIKHTAAVIGEIRARGVKTSLDDFGTGYSSLSHLQLLPFDYLKIDRSFVAGLAEAGEQRPIVRAILDLARTLGLSVIAEGIETDLQADALRALGCPHGQGFLYGRPLREDACAALLERGGGHARAPARPIDSPRAEH
ncbi:putative bifunctional diguanylate cyclase/phosphodiesterase [Sphingomonas sp. PAMC 26605]|uniref:putative bifunctional diguanylate cyclase/phosphodiesterase n=1 Tax=Sphingomonas sp. PAMC 26605 TaxID=1112214 RepID=UPI00026CD69F|nr:GGDEF domain-containing protein [Sphingomonas sp. PAMC 26605]